MKLLSCQILVDSMDCKFFNDFPKEYWVSHMPIVLKFYFSSKGFLLSRGVTTVSFKLFGVFCSVSDLLVMCWMMRSSVRNRHLVSEEGIRLSACDLELHCTINFNKSSIAVSLNSMRHCVVTSLQRIEHSLN